TAGQGADVAVGVPARDPGDRPARGPRGHPARDDRRQRRRLTARGASSVRVPVVGGGVTPVSAEAGPPTPWAATRTARAPTAGPPCPWPRPGEAPGPAPTAAVAARLNLCPVGRRVGPAGRSPLPPSPPVRTLAPWGAAPGRPRLPRPRLCRWCLLDPPARGLPRRGVGWA